MQVTASDWRAEAFQGAQGRAPQPTHRPGHMQTPRRPQERKQTNDQRKRKKKGIRIGRGMTHTQPTFFLNNIWVLPSHNTMSCIPHPSPGSRMLWCTRTPMGTWLKSAGGLRSSAAPSQRTLLIDEQNRGGQEFLITA